MKNKKKITVFGFVILLFLWGVFLFISKLETANYFLGVDLKLQNLFIAFEYQKLVIFFKVITFLGNWQFIFPLVILIALALWKYKKFKYLWPLLLSVVGSQLAQFVLKAILQKPRSVNSLIFESSYSFPSGHAAIAIAFYGFLIYFFLKTLKKRKILVFLAFSLLIFLIGFSRIYLRVHYYGDVVAGYFLGAIWLTLGILLSKSLEHKIVSKILIPFLVLIIFITSCLFYFKLPHLKPILASKTVVTKDVILEFNNKTLPKFTEKLSGASQQPLSFLIVAKDNQEFLKLFTNEGWTQTERLTFTGIFNLAEAAFTNKSYPQGFITPTFWENKVQDFSFAKLTSQNTVRIRHHCRFWTTNIKTPNARNLYVGYCSFDKGIKPWLITHEIDPNLDKERDYLLNDILKTKEVKSFTKFNFVNPIQGRTFQGDYFYTDGRVYLIDLN